MTTVKLRPDIEPELEQLIPRLQSLNSWCPKLLCLVSYLYSFLWLETNLSKKKSYSVSWAETIICFQMFYSTFAVLRKKNTQFDPPMLAVVVQQSSEKRLLMHLSWNPMDKIVKVKCTATSFGISKQVFLKRRWTWRAAGWGLLVHPHSVSILALFMLQTNTSIRPWCATPWL